MSQRQYTSLVSGLAVALCCGLGFCSSPVFAAGGAVYTWKDSRGVLHFSDQPTNARAQPAHLSLRNYTPPSGPQASSSDQSGASSSVGGSTQTGSADADDAHPPTRSHTPRILMPTAGATIENAKRKVIVSVAIGNDDTLDPDEDLVYRLDGRVLSNAPPKATRLAIDDLSPGRHQLQVMLQNSGKDTGRQDSVAFIIAADSTTSETASATSASQSSHPATPSR